MTIFLCMNLTEVLWNNSNLLSCASFLAPLIIGAIKFPKASNNIKLLISILTISFILTVICYYTGIYFINNLLIYFAQYILEFTFYSILFWRLLNTTIAKIFIIVSAVIVSSIALINYKSIIHPVSFLSDTPAIISLALIMYCILFFNKQLNNPLITFIYKTPGFWIVTGLLLYNAGNFLIFLFTNYLMHRNRDLVYLLWRLRDYLDVTKNILIMIGFFHIKDKLWKGSF